MDVILINEAMYGARKKNGQENGNEKENRAGNI